LQDPSQRSKNTEAVYAIYEVLCAQCNDTASFPSAARHLCCIVTQRMFHTPRQCCTVCHCCTFTPDILCSLLVNTAAYGMQVFPIARLADDCTCAHHRLFHSAVGMQGVPFSVAGCADLLALFRCVSCRYKFGTDTSKPVLMVSWFFAVLKIL